MSCRHRGVRWDGTCDGCGVQLAPPPATLIVARIARCAHADPLELLAAGAPAFCWCRSCGAIRNVGVVGWLEPWSWVSVARAHVRGRGAMVRGPRPSSSGLSGIDNR